MLKSLTEMRELNNIDKLVGKLRAIKADGLLELKRLERGSHGFIDQYALDIPYQSPVTHLASTLLPAHPHGATWQVRRGGRRVECRPL